MGAGHGRQTWVLVTGIHQLPQTRQVIHQVQGLFREPSQKQQEMGPEMRWWCGSKGSTQETGTGMEKLAPLKDCWGKK